MLLSSCGSLRELTPQELTTIQKAQYPIYNTNTSVNIIYTTGGNIKTIQRHGRHN